MTNFTCSGLQLAGTLKEIPNSIALISAPRLAD
jgi:hypothetical protein